MADAEGFPGQNRTLCQVVPPPENYPRGLVGRVRTRRLGVTAPSAMEKNLEIMIGRRFKRWGRRWTRRGAPHLLKLRLWIARCGTSWFEALNARPAQLTNA